MVQTIKTQEAVQINEPSELLSITRDISSGDTECDVIAALQETGATAVLDTRDNGKELFR